MCSADPSLDYRRVSILSAPSYVTFRRLYQQNNYACCATIFGPESPVNSIMAIEALSTVNVKKNGRQNHFRAFFLVLCRVIDPLASFLFYLASSEEIQESHGGAAELNSGVVTHPRCSRRNSLKRTWMLLMILSCWNLLLPSRPV